MTDSVTASLLRLEVGRLRAGERRRRFDTVVHLGRLGEAHRACSVPVPSGDPVLRLVLDPGTRTDVVARMLETQHENEHANATEHANAAEEARRSSVWLTRPGEPVVQDEDLAWLSAAFRAFDALGWHLDRFWSVTRTGWLDVRTGDRRTWKRLRL
jgi:hypothetical protein